MLAALLKGLVPFVSVVVAVVFYQRPEFISYLVLAFVFALICGGLTWSLAGAWPRTAAIVVNGWYAMPPVLLAASSLLVFWLTLNARQFFDPAIDSKLFDTLSGALVGAATAFLAALWTDDITKHEGRFWPGRLLKDAWGAVYDGHQALEEPPPRSPAAEAAYAALYDDDTGWGPVQRYTRACNLWSWVKTLPPP